ncbi:MULTISPECIES: hypothetical protein [Streptomyces]|uniref:Uncharacterized protein n=1 Tax=Streptomyces venezuelae TaxID=54571 RepID=A0A5P2B4U5_STRVZ|nr:hypothetical protein [Streptomyces venezuelae]QES23369.1 hypothetical protein DEJ46_33105 [Streptomyces venezuelae]
MNVGWPEAVIAIVGVAALVAMVFALRHRLRKVTVRMPGASAGFEGSEEPRGLSEQEFQAHDSVFKNSELTMPKGARTAFFRSKAKRSKLTITTGDGTGSAPAGEPTGTDRT